MKSLGRKVRNSQPKTKALITKEHCIDDASERSRLKKNFPGKYIIGSKNNEGLNGYFYPNATWPYTGGLLPTRGFGNRLYHGSGWIHEPEVSKVIRLSPGTLIFGSSDGVFDRNLWGEDVKHLVDYVRELKRKSPIAKPGAIAEKVFIETTKRCIETDQFRVDDISIFALQIPNNPLSLEL